MQLLHFSNFCALFQCPVDSLLHQVLWFWFLDRYDDMLCPDGSTWCDGHSRGSIFQYAVSQLLCGYYGSQWLNPSADFCNDTRNISQVWHLGEWRGLDHTGSTRNAGVVPHWTSGMFWYPLVLTLPVQFEDAQFTYCRTGHMRYNAGCCVRLASTTLQKVWSPLDNGCTSS